MAHWSGIGIPKTNAIALEVSYTHTHGIEVYHIAPAPSSQTPFDDSPLVTRNSQPKFLVASKSHFPRGPGRGGNRTSKSRSRCSNTGGNDAKSERKENKKFFQFLRKKK